MGYKGYCLSKPFISRAFSMRSAHWTKPHRFSSKSLMRQTMASAGSETKSDEAPPATAEGAPVPKTSASVEADEAAETTARASTEVAAEAIFAREDGSVEWL